MIQPQGRRLSAIAKLGFVAPVLLTPIWASAQFALVSQSGQVNAAAYQSSSVSDASAPGATGSLALSVVAGNYNVVTSNAGVTTTVEPGRIGLRVSVGGSSFDRNFSWTCSTYYYGGGCSTPSATSTASGELYFDVTQQTQAAVDISSSYSAYTAGSGFPFKFQKLAADGSWLSVASPGQVVVSQDMQGFRNNFSGALNLDEGHYRMFASYSGSNVYLAPSYSWGGASIMLTAVPEPGSLGLMGIGLLALSPLMRRKK